MPINFTIVTTGKTNDEADETADIAAIGVTGELHFVAQLPAGMPALAPLDGDGGTDYWIGTFVGYLDTDGVLKNEPGGTSGVRIWANDPAFGLVRLPYLVHAPNGLRANGKVVDFTPFVFDAPSTDVVKKFSELQPVPSATAEGISRGFQGFAFAGLVPADGDTAIQALVESLSGPVPVGDPVALPSAAWSTIIGKPAVIASGADAAAARALISVSSTAEMTAAITAAVNGLLNGAPGALDTLKELADAVNDDANFAATVTAAIAAKYTKPGSGIPAADLAAAIQTSLGKADTAYQAPAVVAAGADAASARSAIEAVGLRPLIHHDPSTHANAAISAGDPLDAGTVFSNTGAKVLKYVSGRFGHDPAASSGASSAGYLQVDCGTAVRAMHAEVSWAASALGVVAFVVPSNMATWVGGSVLPAAGFHVGFYGNGQWTLGVWNPGSGGVANGQIHHSVQPGTATSFALTVQTTTPSSTQTTASITTGASAASVQSTLQALSNVGAGNVTVTKSASGNYGITWAAGLGTVTLTATPTGGTMGMAAPLNLVPANTIAGVVSYATGVTTYAADTTAGRYATVWDGVLRFLRVYLYPETDQALIIFPDGTNSGMITHPGIGLWTNGNRAIFELFESNTSSVETPATLGRIAVGNQKFEPDAPIATKPDVIQALAASKVVTLYDGGNATGSDIAVSGSIPPGTAYVELVVIGAGAGAGSGACQPSGTAANGGAGGGSGGVIREIIPASALGTSWAGVIGHRGTGGASVSSTATGNVGTTGTLSKFTSGSVAYQALAGGPGGGGTSGSTTGTAGNGGGPFATVGSAAGANGAAGSAGGSVVANLGTAGAGSGGGVTTAPAANNGGAGGSNLVRGYTGGTAGVVGGASPGQGTDVTATVITSTPAGTPGPGPGGGAASITGAAQAGADAAGWGGGGAGGGASLNGNASGKGGDGKGGYLIVRAHMM